MEGIAGTDRAGSAAIVPAKWAPRAWAALSLSLFLLSSMGIFAVNLLVRSLVEVPHLIEMAEWSIVWGACALVGVLVAGRITFGRWLHVSSRALIPACAGIALSAVVHVVLQQWAIARFEYMDADNIGWTAGLFAVLLGLATATFGVFIAPRQATAWPLAFVLLGATGTVLIVLRNVPGITDGIDPESWPLAIWLGISGLYAAFVTAACVMQARHSGATPKR
jgi:hypothetical protein